MSSIDKNDILVLFLPLVLGMSSGLLVSKKNIPIVKSSIRPPPIVFMIVWPILYIILGVSSYMINKTIKNEKIMEDTARDVPDSPPAKTYLTIFYIHLACLIIWWPLFVYFPNKNLAIISILLLALSSIYIARLFTTVNKTAGLIMTPYIIWLFIASYLTYRT